MNLFLALTDKDWFRFLRGRPELDEVNFWQPGGGRHLRQIGRGAPFLFKLHAPEHFIVGGGFFLHSSTQNPLSRAWEAFGEKNGAASLPELRSRVLEHRSDRHPDPLIGCLILCDPFFLSRENWIPADAYWARGTRQGRYLDMGSGIGRELWDRIEARRATTDLQPGTIAEPPTMYGDPTPVRRRLGQGSFQMLVTDTYQRHCAVTGERALPTLEAAHVLPVSEGGRHELGNGLLLRSDIHRLFDRGYVTVTPDYRFRVSRRLKDEFDNGEEL